MAFIKYSIGQITEIKDQDSVEKREEAVSNSMSDQSSYIIVCKKCGIQHMILQGELARACFCGNVIKLGDLS